MGVHDGGCVVICSRPHLPLFKEQSACIVHNQNTHALSGSPRKSPAATRSSELESCETSAADGLLNLLQHPPPLLLAAWELLHGQNEVQNASLSSSSSSTLEGHGACRYTAITNFLAETEAYLNNLTETIMEKKLHEIKEKAFQAALADARLVGVPEEAAEQQALQAANEAAEKSEFQRLNESLAGDAQVRHRHSRGTLLCSAVLRVARPL